MFGKQLLAATVAATLAATTTALHAADFSNAIFFGDSLSDAGTYAGEAPLAGIFPIAGKFTTNPGDVWTQMLADQLGHPNGPANQGSTIYAAGGARVDAQPGYPNNPLVPFVQEFVPSVDLGKTVRVIAAFCRWQGYLSTVTGEVEVESIDDPKFDRMIGQMILLLFPPIDPSEDDDPRWIIAGANGS